MPKNDERIRIVAEIGCNHKGDMKIAEEMITTASLFCKVDAVKFQKRCPRELLTEAEYTAPHPNPVNSYGGSYGEHREFLEFTLDQHRWLKQLCEKFGLIYSTSVWDLTSAQEIAMLDPEFIKIPSACNLNFPMMAFLCEHFGGDIHISFGMTTHHEEEQIVSFFEKMDRARNLIIYSCTSGYPVAFEDICLLEITRIKERFGDRVKAIGFSGHHLGIAADIAAMVLGAQWIERHFTLNRTWKGTDHAASLEPDGMRKLARDMRNVCKALSYKETELIEVEKEQRKKLKNRHYAFEL
jgi:N-acetylneuraminate synthase